MPSLGDEAGETVEAPVHSLPVELLVAIFDECPRFQDKLAISGVCKWWRTILYDDLFKGTIDLSNHLRVGGGISELALRRTLPPSITNVVQDLRLCNLYSVCALAFHETVYQCYLLRSLRITGTRDNLGFVLYLPLLPHLEYADLRGMDVRLIGDGQPPRLHLVAGPGVITGCGMYTAFGRPPAVFDTSHLDAVITDWQTARAIRNLDSGACLKHFEYTGSALPSLSIDGGRGLETLMFTTTRGSQVDPLNFLNRSVSIRKIVLRNVTISKSLSVNFVYFGDVLRHLDFTGCRLNDARLKEILSACPCLETLILRRCTGLWEGAADSIALLPQLKHLDVTGIFERTNFGRLPLEHWRKTSPNVVVINDDIRVHPRVPSDPSFADRDLYDDRAQPDTKHCPLAQYGCPVTGNAVAMHTHLTLCPFNVAVCCICLQSIQVSEWSAHYTRDHDVPPYYDLGRVVACPVCRTTLRSHGPPTAAPSEANTLLTQHLLVCPQYATDRSIMPTNIRDFLWPAAAEIEGSRVVKRIMGKQAKYLFD